MYRKKEKRISENAISFYAQGRFFQDNIFTLITNLTYDPVDSSCGYSY